MPDTKVADVPEGIEPVTIRYDWIGAYKEVGNIHPQKDMINRGCKVFKYEAVGMGDCTFMLIDKMPDPCPDYIDPSDWEF